MTFSTITSLNVLWHRIWDKPRTRRVTPFYACADSPTRRHFVSRGNRVGHLDAFCAHCKRSVTRKSLRASAWRLA